MGGGSIRDAREWKKEITYPAAYLSNFYWKKFLKFFLELSVYLWIKNVKIFLKDTINDRGHRGTILILLGSTVWGFFGQFACTYMYLIYF
jgi:hypothetical protein